MVISKCHFCYILRTTAFNFLPNWSYTHKESIMTLPLLRENIEWWVSRLILKKKKKLAFVEHFVPNVEFEWSIYLIIYFHGGGIKFEAQTIEVIHI